MTARKQLKRGHWNAGEVKQLRKLFGNHSTITVAAILNRGSDACKKKASRLGLKKTKAYLRSLGRTR